MPTLYRKYRPQSFASITGQQHIIQTITNEIATGKVAQAYLFSGPRGVGKTTIARLLAKAVNCQNRPTDKFEPCNECSSCKEITEGRNIDVIEIDAASHTGVDDVRENIVENAQFKPTKSPFKVFIIDEVHMLSTSSFNALLKTIEEPPRHVIFILATTELHKILPTIVSRCQRFAFQKVPFEQMKTRLIEICAQEEIAVDKAVIERVINKSDGCLRDAESLLGQIMSLNLKKIGVADAEMILPVSDAGTVIGFIEHIVAGTPAEAIKIIADSVADGVNLDEFAFDAIEILRVTMILQSGQNTVNTDYSEDVLKRVRKISATLSPARLVFFIDRLLARKHEIKSAPIPQLPLELLAIEMTAPIDAINDTEKNATKTATPVAPVTIVAPSESLPPPKSTSITSSIKSAISSIAHSHHPIKISLDEIKIRWDEMIKQLDTGNHSLTFVLKLCDLLSTDSGHLNISVPYSFHQEKINDKKNKRAVEDCLEKLCGERIAIACSVVSDGQPAKNTLDNESINVVAADFGGEVVSE